VRILIRCISGLASNSDANNVIFKNSAAFFAFYQAMHYSAKATLRLHVVCLSERDVGGSGRHRFEMLETNCTDKPVGDWVARC